MKLSKPSRDFVVEGLESQVSLCETTDKPPKEYCTAMRFSWDLELGRQYSKLKPAGAEYGM